VPSLHSLTGIRGTKMHGYEGVGTRKGFSCTFDPGATYASWKSLIWFLAIYPQEVSPTSAHSKRHMERKSVSTDLHSLIPFNHSTNIFEHLSWYYALIALS
jgi:hypothetical protein